MSGFYKEAEEIQDCQAGNLIMSRFPDVEGWILVAIGAGVGLLSAWLTDSYRLGENRMKVAAYSVVVFAVVVVALRPAWRRGRLWLDLVVLSLIHLALVLPLANFLDSRSVRLNWVLALPFVVTGGPHLIDGI